MLGGSGLAIHTRMDNFIFLQPKLLHYFESEAMADDGMEGK